MTQQSAPAPRRHLSRSSLRTRFALGVAAMLLPLALLMAGALLSLQSITGAFEDVVEEVAHEMQPIARLQTLLLRAATSLDGYLVRNDRRERERFIRLSSDVDREFHAVTSGPFSLAEEQTAIQAAQVEWQRAKDLIGPPMPLAHPHERSDAVRIMKQALVRIDRAVDVLDGIYQLARHETGGNLAHARVVKRRLTLLMAGFLAVMLVTAIWGGINLARAVFTPLSVLTRTADRFAEGELSHRVDPAGMPEELGRLAGAFNGMAARLQENRAALEALAERDGLTGLYNHRMFYMFLTGEVVRAERFNRPVSLLMFDIDHFKAVNDRHGHLAGDAVLRTLSKRLQGEARAIDYVSRYGGEEFSIILPETDIEAAAVLAERLRAAVEAQPFDVEGTPIRITISVGIASYPAQADSAQALVAAADAALYAAKQGGRNRTVCSEPAARCLPSRG